MRENCTYGLTRGRAYPTRGVPLYSTSDLKRKANMQTIDEVKKLCRMVGEGIVAAAAAGENLGKRFEGVQNITMREFFDTAYWC